MHCACQHIRYHSDSWFHNDYWWLWEAVRQTNIFSSGLKGYISHHIAISIWLIPLQYLTGWEQRLDEGLAGVFLSPYYPWCNLGLMDIRGAPALMDIRSRIGSHHPPPSASTIGLHQLHSPALFRPTTFDSWHCISVSAEIRAIITVPYCTGTNSSTHLPSFVCLSFMCSMFVYRRKLWGDQGSRTEVQEGNWGGVQPGHTNDPIVVGGGMG